MSTTEPTAVCELSCVFVMVWPGWPSGGSARSWSTAITTRSTAGRPRCGGPSGAHLFGAEQLETVTVERQGQPLATVSGISYRARGEDRPLWQLFQPRQAELFGIGLLHCNCGSNTGHEAYVPCQVSDLVSIGLDYWALGHVHNRGCLSSEPHIVYPGNLQGLHRGEGGAKGCTLVTVEDRQVVRLEFRPLDQVRWLTEQVSIDELITVDALEQALQRAIEHLAEAAEDRAVIAQLVITGRGPLYDDLRQEGAIADLLERLRELGQGRTPLVWVDQLIMAAQPQLDLNRRREMGDLLGQALRVAADLEGQDDLSAAAQPALGRTVRAHPCAPSGRVAVRRAATATVARGPMPVRRSAGGPVTMRIAGLHIDGFGIFRDLDLTDLPAGLLVIHGHNEAGKSYAVGLYPVDAVRHSPMAECASRAIRRWPVASTAVS